MKATEIKEAGVAFINRVLETNEDVNYQIAFEAGYRAALERVLKEIDECKWMTPHVVCDFCKVEED